MILFNENDFEEKKGKEKRLLPENIKFKMRISEIKDGVLESSNLDYFVLRCVILEGDDDLKNEEHDIFVNTGYVDGKGVLKATHTFKRLLAGFCKEAAQKLSKEKKFKDAKEELSGFCQLFRSNIDPLIGSDFNVSFFKPDNGYQNVIYFSTSEINTESKGESKEAKQEDF